MGSGDAGAGDVNVDANFQLRHMWPSCPRPGSCVSGLRTLIHLDGLERGLLLRTIPVVAAIRIALWFLPVRRVRRLIGACERLPLAIPAETPVFQLVWAVRAAGRRIPMATCLTQSLALQFLLTRTGRSSQLHIGVKNDPQAGLLFHAWVECEGSTLLSPPSEAAEYSHLLAWQDRTE